MPDQALAALRELTEAVMAEFFGNDTNLSKRLIKATNEAQLVLIAQPPDDDRVNQPAPAEPVAPVDLDALLSPAGAYETGPDAARGTQLQEAWGDMAPADAVAGLAQLADKLREEPGQPQPAVIGVDIPGPDGDWADIADLCQAEGVEVQAGGRLLRRARAAWGQASQHADHIPGPTKMVAPPAEGDAGELAAELRHFLAGYQQMRGLDPEYIYSIHRGDAMEAHLRVSRLIRAADLLQQQAAELAALRQLAAEISALVSESEGVAGLHLNGDVAPWDELLPGGRFEWLTSLPQVADWLDGVAHD